MALFKILAGKEKVSNGKSIMTFDESLSTPIPNTSGIDWHEGWAYVTPDTGNMFIDVSNNGKPKRIKIGELADKALQAVADHEGNIFIETYIKDIELKTNASEPYYRIIKPDNSKSYSVDIPVANESIAGVITADTTKVQVLAGPKTFTGQIIIKGDKSTKPLITSNLLGSNGETGAGPLYLQFGNEVNDVIYLGETGGATITDNGQQYSGNAATATNALNDGNGYEINETYIGSIVLQNNLTSGDAGTANTPRYVINKGDGTARGDYIDIPIASTTQAGIITTLAQSFTGVKDFAGFNYSGVKDNQTNTNTHYLWMGLSSALGTPVYSSKLKYVPSEDTLTCANFNGNASSATKAIKDGDEVAITSRYVSNIEIANDYKLKVSTPEGVLTTLSLPFAASDTCGGVATSAKKWNSSATITLAGHLTGSVTFDGPGSYSLNASVSATAFENVFNGRYVQVTGDTMTGALTTPNLVISSSSAVKHIEFKRPNANYFTAPESGYFCFVPDGKSIDVANSTLVITGSSVYPGTSSAISLGTSSNKWSAVYADKVYNAVWNDYAECRKAETLEPGRVVVEDASGEMKISTERLQPGANIISDTYGTCMGETDECKTPIAVAGRVLAYTYEDRNSYPLGAAVCAAPNGTVSLMTREEIREYPERIIGTVSEIPNYEIWGSGNVVVNNRIWIKVQ